jgi:membrane protein implicated in regulation of membrane protease activity
VTKLKDEDVQNPLSTTSAFLMGLFITYVGIFIFYTAEEFVTGGSSAVVGWYMHIDSSLVRRGDGWFLTKWSWEKFLVQQFAILAVTLALYFAERRSKRVPRNQEDNHQSYHEKAGERYTSGQVCTPAFSSGFTPQ